MATKYARRRVFISHSISDGLEEAIILSCHKDAGQWWYRVKYVDGGAIADIPARDFCMIMHRKSKVSKISKKLKLVK